LGEDEEGDIDEAGELEGKYQVVRIK